MANLTRNFIAGRMNKSVDERLVPNGEYVDALNIRMGSTEQSEVGVIENSKGNLSLTTLSYNGNPLSSRARCIGAFDDGTNETLYWFVHDSLYPSSPTGKIDLVVSFNTTTNTLIYHLISVNEGFNINTTLNFDPKFLITGVNKVEDLLYWTDDFNQPRQINVKRNYANPVVGVDGFFNEAILVIKQPPIASPTVVPTPTSSQDNFLEERFICFAYRYRYEDNEYSATSQWSKPAFLPNSFRYDFATALNSGMSGTANMAVITYNSGGPLVKSIELLFKENQFPTIRIIEKFNKQTEGLADNTNYTFEFQNSQIFTILENSEILRLYDNVPLLAKAQTTMGNRLMYGNYVDGYDMVDLGDSPVRLEYISNVISEEIGSSDLEDELTTGFWTFDGAQNLNNGKILIDFTGINLVAGGIFTLELRYKFGLYGGQAPFPTDQQVGTGISFTYILQQPFANVFELFQDADFQDKIGTALNIETVADACTGTTFTDAFNCSVEQTLEAPGGITLYKYESGQSQAGQPIETYTGTVATNMSFQLPAMRYVDDPNFTNITQSVYAYYEIESAEATYSEIGNPSSLHSNRGYEVGIVYMDGFNRSSTALVSNNNAVHIPCASSALQNKIQVTIPTGQRAPSWAKRYKFCIKADKEIYETIYTTFFFRDTNSNDDWFLLDGQNSQKVKIGSELIVKTDTSGPRSSCTYTTVLDKVAQAADWLDPAPIDDDGFNIKVPGGTYMRLSANNFSTTTDINDGLPATWTQGEKLSNTKDNPYNGIIGYQINVPDPNTPGQFVDLPIPAGSKILIKYESIRIGKNENLEGLTYIYEQNFTSSQDYSSFKTWWDGDNIGGTLNAAFVVRTATFNQSPPTATYDPTLDNTMPINNLGVNFKFVFQSNTQPTSLTVSGSLGYDSRKKRTNTKMEILIQRANSLVVFETEPIDAAPNIWLESSEAYNINTTTGEHLSPDQSQDFANNTPALIVTDFFNCYSFGNGVESYKIEDAITGKQVELGNRAYTTTDTDFKRVRRYSDITYSGVYNEESNRNGLNEFNLGLLNFKSCEQSFGPINKLFARQRDILTLQEDKISYVQTDINLLSDAAGGSGVVVAIPKVLGSQVARAEEYGISNNPESFVQWGPDKYFTDAKRGSVISLKGQTAESLTAVSMMGMRSWFRDLFIDDFDTQKLGGFDPYMNEYVISSNGIKLPAPVVCEDCGITTSIEVKEGTDYITCYELGDLVGDVVVDYTVSSVTGTFTVTSLYNGISTVVGPTSTSGTLTFSKNVVNVDTAQIFIDSTDSVSLQLTVNCPAADSITIVLVTITSDNEEGLFTTNQYRWQDGTFISPLHTEKVKFATGNNPIVSSYSTITGPQGGGVIPSNSATVAMFNNTLVPDDFVFDVAADEFRYLRSSTTYANTPTDIQALLATTNIATPTLAPINGNTAYYAQFPMPSTGDYLYLVWDYRNSTPIELCYDATSALTACCDCQSSGGDTPAASGYVIRDCMTGFDYVAEQAAFNFTLGDVVQYKVGTGGGTGVTQCGTVQSSTTVSANASIQNASTYNCDDETDCPTCTSYTVSTYSSSGLSYSYTDCDGLEAGGTIGGAGGYDEESFCARRGTVSVEGSINLIQFGPCAP
jgi:hypothetical protein